MAAESDVWRERGRGRGELLRFVIVGSVDDGKSTLIGRLLYELAAVPDDQLESMRVAGRVNGGEMDFALLTDGLEAEREQGITIDVAYRYFTSDRRKFIVADTPGHVQYTRNMVTGASTAHVCVIVVDVRLGVLEQSRRHACIASLLGIPNLLVVVNKMDLVAYSAERFASVCADFRAFCARLAFREVRFLPLSALRGENVVTRSTCTPWHDGPTLAEYLDEVGTWSTREGPMRYAVQYVLRPNADYRGYCGRVAEGRICKGDEVLVLPSRRRTTVLAIDRYGGETAAATRGQNVTLRLQHDLDCARGDMIVHPDSLPMVSRQLEASLVWLDELALVPSRTYLLKHTTRVVRAHVEGVLARTCLATLEEQPAETLEMNEIGRVAIRCQQPLFYDCYAENRDTGSFLFIDVLTNRTVGAGMIARACEDGPLAADRETSRVGPEERAARLGHRGGIVLCSGLRGALAATVMDALERLLFERGYLPYALALDPERLEEQCAAAQICAAAGVLVLCAGVEELGSVKALGATLHVCLEDAASASEARRWDALVATAERIDTAHKR